MSTTPEKTAFHLKDLTRPGKDKMRTVEGRVVCFGSGCNGHTGFATMG
jgi:hypothetical protein